VRAPPGPLTSQSQTSAGGRFDWSEDVERCERNNPPPVRSPAQTDPGRRQPVPVGAVGLGLSRAIDEMEDLPFLIRDNDDTTKIDEAIEKGRSILASDPLSGPLTDHLIKVAFSSHSAPSSKHSNVQRRSSDGTSFLGNHHLLRHTQCDSRVVVHCTFSHLYINTHTLDVD